MDFKKLGDRFRQGLKEGLGISAEFDNDYTNLMQEADNAQLSDEQIYLDFLIIL
jgi:hypothetical protein